LAGINRFYAPQTMKLNGEGVAQLRCAIIGGSQKSVCAKFGENSPKEISVTPR